ncbi:MAG TPA: 5'-3' exonuclease [Ornithinimicrobium sp.]|uniref:5'-3' exonuclease n=1 Tax=Ornithinimicrobium sp. TaxID=1977084 RepID=UPI002B46A0F4|nr:5'-3' exonuclease [Ornithinimicrobium sp.]HKJ12495.1 5'-3' exonuclease [Ornithinimicrobium sp.]
MTPEAGDEPRLLLLDTASLYFRAFYGVKEPQPSPDGTPTNAVRGLLDMVTTLLTRFNPTHLAACWDNDWRPQFRVRAIPSYKEHRLVEGSDHEEEGPPELGVQVPVLRRVLESVGVPVLGADGYEADDVIGTLAHRYSARMPVDVVTGDRDLFQLVDDDAGVRVVYTARLGVRAAELITQEELWHRYAVRTGAAYADMAMLRGDTSDGLPGVKGIGDKTAAQLIETYGSLALLREAVAQHDPAIKGARRANLEAAHDYLNAAPLVVRVALDAPVPDVDLRLPEEIADPGTLAQDVEAYGIAGSVRRLLSGMALDA